MLPPENIMLTEIKWIQKDKCRMCGLILSIWLPKWLQMVKNPPATQETQVQSLRWEDPLEKGMATHSCIPGWEIPRTEKPGGLQSMGSQRVRHD